MCTDTFLRLPEEKRNRFLQAAWEEFTTASFAEASINQIVRRARVPRGSFYQYFLDKWDLFSDLMGLIRDHFEEEFRKLSIQSGGDLFRTIPLCYDRFVQHGPAADPLFERCLRILRLNSGLFLQLMLSDPPDHHCFLESAWETLDPSCPSQPGAGLCPAGILSVASGSGRRCEGHAGRSGRGGAPPPGITAAPGDSSARQPVFGI